MTKLFDNPQRETPASVPTDPVKIVAPFPKGETEKRRRKLIAEGFTITDGGSGPTVFRFGDRH
jgi:hypothetical protein